MKRIIYCFLLALCGFVLTGTLCGGYDRRYSEGVAIFMMMWLLLLFLIIKSIKRIKDEATLSVIYVFLMMIGMMAWAYLGSYDYLVFRTKQVVKMKYGDELVLRGADYVCGNTHAVYYRKSEPEYFFHLPAWLFSLDFQDDQYHQAVAASIVDDKIEALIQNVIHGEFKMSSECMSMRFHEKPVNYSDYSNIENIAYFQMYCVLDNSLIEHKDEIIEKVTEIVEPIFWNAEATIFFAFVEDVESSERYSSEYHNEEDTLVRFH
ncbi:MAG: hypothetical protein IJ356_09720 [Erysipelotrichaceae bacterium]|nr:hypothetical protein [Erysipelotrichaceae bacterium]